MDSTGSTSVLAPAMTGAAALAWATSVTDGLGMPIDPGIVKLVAGLHRYGIETVMSCEGHSVWGAGYPWITLSGQANYWTALRLIEAMPSLDGFEIHIPDEATNLDYDFCELRPRDLPAQPLPYRGGGLLGRLLLPGSVAAAVALERKQSGEPVSFIEELQIGLSRGRQLYNAAVWRWLLDPMARRRNEPRHQKYREACHGRLLEWREAIYRAGEELTHE